MKQAISHRSTGSVESLERRRFLSTVPVGPEIPIGPSVGIVALDADGDFVVASQIGPSSNYDVQAQRYNAAGIAQGAAIPVNTYTPGSQYLESIACDSAGDFVVNWSGGGGIFARLYNAAGVPQGDQFLVSAGLNSSVAMDDDGDFVVTLDRHYDTVNGRYNEVFAQRYNAAGVPQGGLIHVNTNRPLIGSSSSSPKVAMDAVGDFVIAWRGSQDGSQTSVQAQRFNASGVPQGTEFTVNTYTTSYQDSPCVGIDDDGDFVIAWTSYLQDGSFSGVYAQRYNALGVAQGSEFRVNNSTLGGQLVGCMAMDAAGDFVIVWDAGDGSNNGAYARNYNAAGVPEGDEFLVNAFTTGTQHPISVSMDDSGNYVATWLDFMNGHLGGYAQRFAVSPEVTGSSVLYETAPHRLSFTFNRDVSASVGVDDLLLENLTTSQTIATSDLSLSYVASTNTATFTYMGNAGGIAGVLPDGNYRATLIASGITNPDGIPLAANHVLNFFFLNGDANRDRRVNLQDFNILAANFGQSPRTFSQGDFNYDGAVNLQDFNILAARFGTVLASPGAGTSAIFGRARAGSASQPDDEPALLA